MSLFKLERARTRRGGFSLVELLVVVAVISVLSSIAVINTTQARNKAKIARVQADLGQIAAALHLLYEDTGQFPMHLSTIPCGANPEIELEDPKAGLQSTDGSFPRWDGPYMKAVPLDPWGKSYFFDADYLCSPSTLGCQGLNGTYPDGPWIRVILSFGPNGEEDYSNSSRDKDDIVMVLCAN